MTGTEPLDADWLAAHPLPDPHAGSDKNARGRVLLIGGSMFVPGALALTGEAVLRSGAGKLQIATVDAAAMALGVRIPEAAMIALPTDEEGEIDPAAVARLEKPARHADTLLIGPGMVSKPSAAALIEGLLDLLEPEQSVVLDAAAISCANGMHALVGRRAGRVIMTPHHGEMASLSGRDIDDIAKDPLGSAQEIAKRYASIVVLKAAETLIVSPDRTPLLYRGGGVGLATGGSGDVLAGIIAGLAAQGTDPFAAAAWGVWLHGEAGRRAAERHGAIGFLARDLPVEIPRLREEASAGECQGQG